MQEICSYQIEIQGRLGEKDFNAMSPYQIMDICMSPTATTFTIFADQSGLVGFIRHLHQQGFVLLSIYRKQ